MATGEWLADPLGDRTLPVSHAVGLYVRDQDEVCSSMSRGPESASTPTRGTELPLSVPFEVEVTAVLE